MIHRIIPSTRESLPVIGLGTWQTFDVNTEVPSPHLSKVLRNLYEQGRRLIDSSPMYGNAEAVIGKLAVDFEEADQLFYATKVWTMGKQESIRQMEASSRNMRRPVIDLMQIHNLVDWKTHLATMRDWKEAGRIRYIGITHYTDASHQALEEIIVAHPIDFVQFNYSIFSRHAEKRLLSAAAAHNVATIINRPFGEGKAFKSVSGKKLPDWAKAYGINSWGQFFLRYIISNPNVTCVIPATADPSHMLDNAAAGIAPILSEEIRRLMVKQLSAL